MDILYCIFFFVFSLIFVAPCHAAQLTIVGSGKFSLHIEDGNTLRGNNDKNIDDRGAKLLGAYSIENKGDEIATNVCPHLAMGSWSWQGQKQIIKPGEKKIWTIEENIPSSDLSAFKTDSKTYNADYWRYWSELPLLITNLYEDLNGYEFSSVNVQKVHYSKIILDNHGPEFGPDGAVNATKNVSEQIDLSKSALFQVVAERDFWRAKVKLINESAEVLKFKLRFHFSKELRAENQLEKKFADIEVGPHSSVDLDEKIFNEKGLIGSTYQLFLLIIAQGSARQDLLVLPASITIKPNFNHAKYILAICVSLIVGIVCFIVTWYLPRDF